MKIFINKKFKNRHIILETLQRRYDQVYNPNMQQGELEMSFIQLVDRSKLTEQEVIEQLDYLQLEDEISIDEIQFDYYYTLLNNGSKAFYDKKYLNIGKKEFLENIYDILKIVSTAILLTIALSTFIINTATTIKLTKEVSKLQSEVRALKNSR